MFRLLLLCALLSVVAVTPSAGQATPGTICATYTPALFTVDNGTNELALISAVVVRAAFGGSFTNTATPPVTTVVDGIVQRPTTSGQANPIYGYFDSSIPFKTNPTNYTVNPVFNTATPPTITAFNNAAWGSLASHLFTYFGALLGCNIGSAGWGGSVNTADMYAVHAGMNLNQTHMNYFDTAVLQSMASFGVSAADRTAVTSVFQNYFQRCAGPVQGVSAISSSSTTGRTQICDAGYPACTNSTNLQCGLYQSGASGISSVSIVVVVSAAAFAVASALLF